VVEYFRVFDEKATEIISIIQSKVSKWESIAEKVGILKAEMNAIAKAFNSNRFGGD
jgi:hypothetical protein